MKNYLQPDWPAPANVHARVSLRSGGVSEDNFSSFNLATHVGDKLELVEQNRARFSQQLGLVDANLVWGQQVHGKQVLSLPLQSGQAAIADGFYTRQPGQACLVMTADCLPVFFASCDGQEVAVAHAGWRGLAAGVLNNTLAKFSQPSSQVICYLGPAIGPLAFQVGADVYRAFNHLDGFENAFKACQKDGFYWADIYALARLQLIAAGVASTAIYGGDDCTVTQNERFFSYRRDAKKTAQGVLDTGRMASVIWLDN